MFGESQEQARNYSDITKELFELVLSDILIEGSTDEVKRIGIRLVEEGSLALMPVVCGRATELGHAAAAKKRCEAADSSFESHGRAALLDSAGDGPSAHLEGSPWPTARGVEGASAPSRA